MKCYTYAAGKTTTGVSHLGQTKKTCALKLNIPRDWDADQILADIQSKKYADILLYCACDVVDGDSLSSVFPEDCFLIYCPDITIMDNHNNSCYEVLVNAAGAYYVLFSDSMLVDTDKSVAIINEGGKPKISNSPTVQDDVLTDTGDFPILL